MLAGQCDLSWYGRLPKAKAATPWTDLDLNRLILDDDIKDQLGEEFVD